MGVKNKISLDNFKENIKKYNNNIICPSVNIQYNNVDTNSCFNIKKYQQTMAYDNVNIKFSSKNNDDTSYNFCKKVKIYPNKKQKNIIKKWLYVYLDMYNITINYIKQHIKQHDFKLLRDQYYNKNKLEKQIKLKQKNIDKLKKDKLKLINKLDKKYNIKKKTTKTKQDITDLIKHIQDMNKNIKINNRNLYTLKKKVKMISNLYNKNQNYIENFIDWYKVRNTIKNQRDKLIDKSFINSDKPIKKHILDCAIKQACTMYKQCKTNYIKGNIKKFRVRFWRKNKKTLQMEIGSEFIKQSKEDKTYNICYDIFGKMKYYYNDKPYDIENKTVNIHYDQENKVYTLLVADTKQIIENKKTNYIAIDEGIRTFCTGISNNEVIKIGTDISTRIGKYLTRIDNINKIEGLTQKEKANKSKKYYRKMKNIVSELHWKTIKYITDNYKNIVIGNLSMKNASQNDKISKITKRIGLMLSHYSFRQKLQYKCATKKNNLEIINESYTSKICSKCSYYKKNLRDEKIYDCSSCNIKIDRDINGCRGILIKCLE
jgi:putative transposase